MNACKTLVWIRNDLRFEDNAALFDAAERGCVEICYVVSEAQWRSHDVGERRLGLIHHALSAFARECAELGLPLHILNVPWYADIAPPITRLAKERQITHLAFNLEYPLNEARRDEKVGQAAEDAGLEVSKFHANVTLPPGTVTTATGEPYKVFSAFKKNWLTKVAALGHEPLPRPKIAAASYEPAAVTELSAYGRLVDLELWPVAEHEVQLRLSSFVDEKLDAYQQQRDHPGIAGTSRLSAALSLGLISANRCLHEAAKLGSAGSTWINELIWREFYKHVVALWPHVSQGCAFKPEMEDFKWRHAPDELAAWQNGETGYPLVDAAMRQLLETGWMHNRLRMVTAMFLSKHLLIDWREGERFFMRQLLDGDFAANNGGWQWSASTGTDAVPYFRIFNPATQGHRFDTEGHFTRSYLPVLQTVPKRYLFNPHEAGLPLDYPLPIVEHRFARERALLAFKG